MRYQKLVAALLIAGTLLALAVIGTARAQTADKPILSLSRIQFGPTAIYEFRGSGTALIPSHKLEPALGVSLAYSLTDRWAFSATLARWMVPLGGQPAENYANLKFTWILFDGEKK
jgi:hypothetical protein